jgi:hypothetical protein
VSVVLETMRDVTLICASLALIGFLVAAWKKWR